MQPFTVVARAKPAEQTTKGKQKAREGESTRERVGRLKETTKFNLVKLKVRTRGAGVPGVWE